MTEGAWSGLDGGAEGVPSQQPCGSLRCASVQTFEEHDWIIALIIINPECTRRQKLSSED